MAAYVSRLLDLADVNREQINPARLKIGAQHIKKNRWLLIIAVNHENISAAIGCARRTQRETSGDLICLQRQRGCSPMKHDRQIQQQVLAELDCDRNIMKGTIGVEVHHGVVKLAGRVDDPTMKRNAELAARRVADVTSVVMDIDVGGGFASARSLRKSA
jgi:hypothetical protein